MNRNIFTAEVAGFFLIAACAFTTPVLAGDCPELVGQWPYGSPYAVAVSGGHAYFGSGLVLKVADVSNPAEPHLVGEVVLPGVVWGVAVSGSHAYVASGSGLRVIDVSTPASPIEVGVFDTPGNAYAVAVSDGYAYVADGISGGLWVIDVSTPSSPIDVGFSDIPFWVRDVAVSGDYAYLADAIGGLRVIDVSTPSSPIEVGFHRAQAGPMGVAVVGDLAYVADDAAGMAILDVSSCRKEVQNQVSHVRRWQPVGPGGIEVHSLHPHPTNPDIVYARSAGSGIYRSGDRGETWHGLWVGEYTDQLHSFIVSPGRPDTMFTMRSGPKLQIRRSDDGGASWIRLPVGDDEPTWGDGLSRRIAVLEDKPWVVLHTSPNGVFRSEHSGDDWVPVSGLTAQDSFNFIMADPSRSGTLWLGGYDSFHVSTDTGVTWTEVSGVPGVTEMAFDPFDGDHILAAANDSAGPERLYRSTNGGKTFSKVAGSTLTFAGLAFDPGASGVVYGTSYQQGDVGGLFRSRDRGETWERLQGPALTDWSGVDVEVIGATPRVLASSMHGIAASDDGGESWRPANRGMPTPQITGFTALGADPQSLLTATHTGLFFSRDAGATWWRSTADTEVIHPNTWGAPIIRDPWDPFAVFVLSGQIYYSTDGGRSFSRVSDERVTTFQPDLHDPSVWYAIRTGSLIRSSDKGQSWQEAGGGIDGSVDTFQIDPFHPGVLLAVNHAANLYRSTDSAASWHQVYTFEYPQYLTVLQYDRTTPDRVYSRGGFPSGTLVSENGGLQWTQHPRDLSDDFADPWLYVADPHSPGKLYGNVDRSLWVDGEITEIREMVTSADAGVTWVPFTEDGLPAGPRALILQPDVDGVFLYATVFGIESDYGVFRLRLRLPKPRRTGGRLP